MRTRIATAAMTWMMMLSLGTLATAAEPADAIDAQLLDPRAFAAWVDGKETPVPDSAAKGGVTAGLWTRTTRPEWNGIRFGEGRSIGPRHLRIGFVRAIPVGSVLARGGGTLSVLKSGAAYPGRLDDDSQWISAERLSGREVTRGEVGEDDFALWILPPGTRTRAIRFSHTPRAGDRENAGWLGGAAIRPDRVGNLAPQAIALSAQRDDLTARVANESNDHTWDTWRNGEHGGPVRVSREHPEFLTLLWPRAVTLDGVCLLWAGFSEVEIDAFRGKVDADVQSAPASSWHRIASRGDMDTLYPLSLGPHWIPFAKSVTTRAIRLRITGGPHSGHPHLEERVKDGREVWLGEILALTHLRGGASLASLLIPRDAETPPPIPVRFRLPAPGLVTIVLEDAQGRRVRNLVSEAPFPAGENTAWWDGSDDLLRDPEAARHGVYHVPPRPVAPGTYRARGLWHAPLALKYEFSVYNAGKPAWETADRTGCWLTTHTPPTSVAVAPGARTADGRPLVFLGAFVAEGGHGLQWLHEDGTKLGGQGWVGGNWTGAATLAVDLGPNAIVEHLAYVGSIWEGELRLTAKTRTLDDAPAFRKTLGKEIDRSSKEPRPPVLAGFDGGENAFVLGGIAARDGRIVASLVRQAEILVADARRGELVKTLALADPRGLAFDAEGRLLALSGRRLVRFRDRDLADSSPQVVVEAGLEDPRHVAVDAAGNLYVSDRGTSHQVKVFASDGKPLRAIGKPGAPGVGPYDPDHMNNPNGVAIDAQGRLWVAEADNAPRRVSVWSSRGELLRAFYGPTEYGGGGTLDPRDPSAFFYKGLEFRLDWKREADQLVRVYHRPDPRLNADFGPYSPDTPLYPGGTKSASGRRYFTSCYTHIPTNGDGAAFVWLDGPDRARLVAGLGSVRAWPILGKPEFGGGAPGEPSAFAWTDANGDGAPQPEEVRFAKVRCSGVTVLNDLSVVVARFGDRNVRFAAKVDDAGRPHFDLDVAEDLGPAGGDPPSSGGDQSLWEPGGWSILTNAPAPFSPYGLGGSFRGEPRWSYPSAWPGLHASHEAAVPDRPGMIVGHTRLLGGWIAGKAGPMFGVNGNMGNMYLFTADGLFVATLFHDIRLRPAWASPSAVRGMDVTGVSLHDENFWPSLTQTPDGRIFVVDGGRTSLVRVDGLETIARLPETSVTVTAEDLRRARDWTIQAEARRQQARGATVLTVPMRKAAPRVDGRLDDWPEGTAWAAIDRSGVKANFDSHSKPYDISAALAISGGRLFAAFRTGDRDLLNNTGETPNAPFKHGGCLDLMLAAEPSADPAREAPAAGDERLLITRVKGKTLALLYRAKVPGSSSSSGVSFSSPWRTVRFDAVEDLSDRVELAGDDAGNFELSVPLAAIHWSPKPGASYRGDVGILSGAGGRTTRRVYWSSKATAITADVPSEAELTPRLWGVWKVEGEAK